MTKRYGLSDDQTAKVRTILKEQTGKSEEVLKDESLTLEERFNRLKSLREEEISRVSEVLTAEQRKKYQSDVRPTQSEPQPAPPASPGT